MELQRGIARAARAADGCRRLPFLVTASEVDLANRWVRILSPKIIYRSFPRDWENLWLLAGSHLARRWSLAMVRRTTVLYILNRPQGKPKWKSQYAA